MSDLRSFLIEQAQKPAGHALSDPSSLPQGRTRKRRETKAERQAILEDWKRAVVSLIDRMESWLREADEDHALTIERIPITIRERRFGTYEVEGLRVRLGIEEFLVESFALNTMESIPGDELGTTPCDGVVRISGGYREYTLCRRKTEQGDEWFITDHRTDEVQVLDQSTFEDAVYKLLT